MAPRAVLCFGSNYYFVNSSTNVAGVAIMFSYMAVYWPISIPIEETSK